MAWERKIASQSHSHSHLVSILFVECKPITQWSDDENATSGWTILNEIRCQNTFGFCHAQTTFSSNCDCDDGWAVRNTSFNWSLENEANVSGWLWRKHFNSIAKAYVWRSNMSSGEWISRFLRLLAINDKTLCHSLEITIWSNKKQKEKCQRPVVKCPFHTMRMDRWMKIERFVNTDSLDRF